MLISKITVIIVPAKAPFFIIDVNAQLNLDSRHAEGSRAPKNINEEANCYKRAADQGDVRGRANLNYLIEDYNGVIKR